MRFSLNIMDFTQVCKAGVSKWSAQVTQVVGKSVSFQVLSPPNAPVGKYGVFVESSLNKQEDTERRFEMEDDEIYLLFNPWCKGEVFTK